MDNQSKHAQQCAEYRKQFKEAQYEHAGHSMDEHI